MSLANVTSALTHLPEIIGIVRDLAAFATDTAGWDSSVGIEGKVETFLAIAKRAAALTPTTADEHAIDVVAGFVDTPEAATAIDALVKYVKSVDDPAAPPAA